MPRGGRIDVGVRLDDDAMAFEVRATRSAIATRRTPRTTSPS
jgi:hypothetical protein